LTDPDEGASPTFSGPHRPFAVRVANVVGAALRRHGMRFPRLDLESLLEAVDARDQSLTGSDAAFCARLQALLDDAEHSARLNFVGRLALRSRYVNLLRNRLLARQWLSEHPETIASMVDRPLFVIGHPRTGTTLLYELLAQDPAVRSPRSWELLAPVPPTDPDGSESDDRFAMAERDARRLAWVVPHLATAHSVLPQEPEECFPLLETSALSASFMLYQEVPRYWQALKTTTTADAAQAYREFASLVRVMQIHARGRRWVSKSPAHLMFLDVLCDTLPGARLVVTHRDPLESVPSLCSLMALIRSAASDEVDLHGIGAMVVEFFVETARRLEAARARLDDDRIIDVDYRELVARPIEVVERIYSRFGYTYSAQFAQRMDAWLSDHPQHKHGVHRYGLEPFGLRPGDVLNATAA
jgi:hypothetical protein